ncbi:hypothetical protein OPQ81_005117 [Rhizoctonia solani]|nr:hypothetical protein OPQ81_005117 [Rhizoctonia solani]
MAKATYFHEGWSIRPPFSICITFLTQTQYKHSWYNAMRSFGKLFLLLLTVILGLLQPCLGQAFPDCSIGCLGKSDPGSCSLQDNKCLCAHRPFVEGTYACFKSSCTNPSDLKNAYDTAAAMCNQAGATETIVAPPKRTLISARRGYPIAVGWA